MLILYLEQDVCEQAHHREGSAGLLRGAGEESTSQISDGKCWQTTHLIENLNLTPSRETKMANFTLFSKYHFRIELYWDFDDING